MRDARYEESGTAARSRNRLLLYTDGSTDAANASEDFFGLERVKMALTAGAALAPDAAADALLNTMDAWSGRPIADDLTHRARGRCRGNIAQLELR